MRSVGLKIRQAISDEVVANTLGVAYDFAGDFLHDREDEQSSMYFM